MITACVAAVRPPISTFPKTTSADVAGRAPGMNCWPSRSEVCASVNPQTVTANCATRVAVTAIPLDRERQRGALANDRAGERRPCRAGELNGEVPADHRLVPRD